VTHDIDEAIKLADRVAILNVGGVFEQYVTPEELLRAPASPFVEGFLGRDRALKRLSLLRVSDLPPSLLLPAASGNGAVVSADTTLRDALDTLLGSPGGRARVLDGDGAEVGVVTVESISGSLR
jgi:osmoprotectant transport system ATP-binding protein